MKLFAVWAFDGKNENVSISKSFKQRNRRNTFLNAKPYFLKYFGKKYIESAICFPIVNMISR